MQTESEPWVALGRSLTGLAYIEILTRANYSRGPGGRDDAYVHLFLDLVS